MEQDQEEKDLKLEERKDLANNEIAKASSYGYYYCPYFECWACVNSIKSFFACNKPHILYIAYTMDHPSHKSL